MRVAIVTDSSTCVPRADVPSCLRTLPITIHLPTEDLCDDDSRAAHRVYRALDRGEAVKSSSPSVLDYVAAIEDSGADRVLVITPAVEFTVMYRSAHLAAQIATVPAAVVDSRTAATGHGLVVLAACEAAAGGGTLDEVRDVALDAAGRAELVATIDDLAFIRRGGRIPPRTIESAQRLGFRPVFRLRDGIVERVSLSPGTAAAYERIRREWAEGDGASAHRSAVFHAARPGAATELADVLGGTDLVAEFSPAMGIHTGPGVVGVSWLRAS